MKAVSSLQLNKTAFFLVHFKYNCMFSYYQADAVIFTSYLPSLTSLFSHINYNNYTTSPIDRRVTWNSDQQGV